MRKKKYPVVTYDPSTDKINSYLLKVPGAGKLLSRLYLWRFCTFNFMIVGAIGMIIQFVLYEGIFRLMLKGFWGGTFLGMLITVFVVFMWNYVLNRHWSLGINSQIITMNKGDLLELQEKVKALLAQKFSHKGERLK